MAGILDEDKKLSFKSYNKFKERFKEMLSKDKGIEKKSKEIDKNQKEFIKNYERVSLEANKKLNKIV